MLTFKPRMTSTTKLNTKKSTSNGSGKLGPGRYCRRECREWDNVRHPFWTPLACHAVLVTNRWWHIATSRWREYPYHELTPLASMFCSSVQVHPWRKWYINGTSPWRSTRPLVLFQKKKKKKKNSLATSLVSVLKFILCWAFSPPPQYCMFIYVWLFE